MSNITETINQLGTLTSVIVVTLSLVSCVPGVVGLMLNILVFTRPTLRHESCSLYFFSSTCFNLFIGFIVMPVRVVSNSFNIDMANYNLGLCKIEFFAFYVARATSCWLITLACVDRYLHSSSNAYMRRLSSLKTARFLIVFASVLLILLYSHMIFYYEINNGTDQNGKVVPVCNGQRGFYRTFLALWHMSLYSLCPSFFMFLFGILTLNNIHHHRRVLPLEVQNNRIIRRTDRQLLRMLIVQVLAIIISTLPFGINRLYQSFTASIPKDALRTAQENVITQTVNTISYFAHSSSFYLYTLTGTVFRREFFRIVSRCLCHGQNVVRVTYTNTNQVSIFLNNQQHTRMANGGITK